MMHDYAPTPTDQAIAAASGVLGRLALRLTYTALVYSDAWPGVSHDLTECNNTTRHLPACTTYRDVARFCCTEGLAREALYALGNDIWLHSGAEAN